MKIGIVGAGTMGGGIAQAFAAAGKYSVTLCDVSVDFANKGLARILARLDKSVEKGRMDKAAAQKILAAITAAERNALAGCDLVIEAALEDIALKKELFAEQDKLCPPDTIFATNTSSCSITAIGSAISRPLTGMHFFNPAETMKL
ncbi:MAG: 3-hydroxybutyryl-CoA dehydrogenase, partial [Candidatus Adiutrix sp.]|nr:3-hydroxybutyryl-CoA dehydrogenase [Candidatus Adiutrix sp.]